MLRTRARVVFLLIILILLVVSGLLGLVTWWLDQQTPPQDRGADSELWTACDQTASASSIVTGMERWTG